MGWLYLGYNICGIFLVCVSVYFCIMGGLGNTQGNGFQLTYTLPFIVFPALLGQSIMIYSSIFYEKYYNLIFILLYHTLMFFSCRIALPGYLKWILFGIRHDDLFCGKTDDMTWSEKLWYGGDPRWMYKIK